jgi:2-dehydropantoate 2-reductase
MVNILIYGAGAIGSFVGYLLSQTTRDEVAAIESVALLGRRSHVQTIRKAGLRICFPEGHKSLICKQCFSSLDELRDSDFFPDLVIVCVKTYSLRRVMDDIMASGMLNGNLKNADFILLMNGMGNREIFNLSPNNVFEGITSMGVNFSEDGSIELKGGGKTVFEDGIGSEIKQFLKERFDEKGFEIEFAKNFRSQQWNKLFVNSVINPITALSRKQNSLVLSAGLKNTVERLVDECVNVAYKEGYRADRNAILNLVRSVASETSANTSSMLQDVLKGRMTEIDSINGYLIRRAKEHKIKVPVNETLYELVKSIEKTRYD